MPSAKVLEEYRTNSPPDKSLERRLTDEAFLCIKSNTNLAPQDFGDPLLMISYWANAELERRRQKHFNLLVSGNYEGVSRWQYFGWYKILLMEEMKEMDFRHLKKFDGLGRASKKALVELFKHQESSSGDKSKNKQRKIDGPLSIKAVRFFKEQFPDFWKDELEGKMNWNVVSGEFFYLLESEVDWMIDVFLVDMIDNIMEALEDGRVRLQYCIAVCVGYDEPFVEYLRSLGTRDSVNEITRNENDR
jgi:hypothetical protein